MTHLKLFQLRISTPSEAIRLGKIIHQPKENLVVSGSVARHGRSCRPKLVMPIVCQSHHRLGVEVAEIIQALSICYRDLVQIITTTTTTTTTTTNNNNNNNSNSNSNSNSNNSNNNSNSNNSNNSNSNSNNNNNKKFRRMDWSLQNLSKSWITNQQIANHKKFHHVSKKTCNLL